MSAKSTTGSTDTFSAEERAAMKERAAELKAQARRGTAAAKAAEAEAQVLVKIAELPDADRVIAERVHAIVREVAPDLAPRTWYGMPAYAKDGKVLCFLKPAGKFESRYSTLGFEDPAALDDGSMWPTSYALTGVTPEVEATIADLVRRAAG
ncbi:iron chaperone [Cellulomonas sp. S1-8]|uniref:iron chaperone n=1 Tax=Cellulomonas sp. S1-8 TaxID=2904790 RepID=UPI00224361E3|nr:DUF1801 domain-containing protein [Cellulomonas sp. S1-8]UZN04753.1 DUF1801 domain-containing protein [Cellulomonas sp. S1-8]